MRMKEERRLQTAEMRFVRSMRGKIRRDRIKNEQLREMAQVEKLQSKIERSRLKWYGHVKRMDRSRLPHQMLHKSFNKSRNIGRPRRRFEDMIRNDVEKRGGNWERVVSEELYKNRPLWRELSRRPVIQMERQIDIEL